MAPNNAWKGYLKLSLVTCPVVLTPAITESEKVRFHILNRATGARVVSQYVDEETGKPVANDELVKAYPAAEGKYVALTDDELAAVKLESVRTIDIDVFVPASSIGWLWYDKPYFLTPDGEVGEEAFAVIRDAMVSTETVGISRLVFYGRERAVMIKPRDNGMVLWTLHYGEEVRDPETYFKTLGESKGDKKEIAHITALIAKHKLVWKPSLADDPVQEALLKLIEEKKKKGVKATPKKKAAAKESKSNVVDITEALRRSLKESGASTRRG